MEGFKEVKTTYKWDSGSQSWLPDYKYVTKYYEVIKEDNHGSTKNDSN